MQQSGTNFFVLTERPKKVLEQSAFAVQSDVDRFLKNMDTRYFNALNKTSKVQKRRTEGKSGYSFSCVNINPGEVKLVAVVILS